MIIDVTGTRLTPGNMGKDCCGNGMHKDCNGNIIECCCDECDYLQCCAYEITEEKCHSCKDKKCPRNEFNKKSI